MCAGLLNRVADDLALLFPACHDVGRVAGPLLTALGVALAPHGCLGGVRGWAARARHGMARGLFELLTLTPPAKPYTETRVFGGFGLADDRNACWSLQPDHEFKLIRALALAACESVPQLAFQFAILMASGASNCPAPGRGGCGPADGGAYSLAAGGVSAWLYFASIAANAMQAVHAWIELTRHARGLPGVGTNAYAAYLLGLRRGGGNKHVTCDLRSIEPCDRKFSLQPPFCSPVVVPFFCPQGSRRRLRTSSSAARTRGPR